ncbi:MAG: (2Fe-2S) ferredoxin domain-containing protein [Candidatus Rickettsia vulgarisii]
MNNNISLNDYHIFICQNQHPNDSPKGCCMSKGSAKLLEHFKKLTENLGIQVTKSGCLNKCAQGVAVVIYPSGIWYSIKELVDVEEIVTSHIQEKQIVNRLLMKT